MLDRNQALIESNRTINRSMLILGTQQVLQDIVPLIQDKRYYQAVALLTEHSQKLDLLNPFFSICGAFLAPAPPPAGPHVAAFGSATGPAFLRRSVGTK